MIRRHRPMLQLALLSILAGCASTAGRSRAVTERWGFTAPWDARSATSVAAHQSSLDVVVSGWIVLDSVMLRPSLLFADSLHAHDTTHTRRFALVTSFHGTRFHPETIRGLTSEPNLLAHTAGEIARLADSAGYRGLILDFEGMTGADLSALIAMSQAVADSARAHHVTSVGMAIPASDTTAYPARPLLAGLDFLVVMLYDQHWLTSPPGPIAAPDWARRQLGTRVGEVGASRLVAAFPLYSYIWRRDSATAVASFDDATRLAASAGLTLEREPSTATLHAQTDAWNVWASDAVLLDALIQDARILGVTRVALWRLGLEDSTIWTRTQPPGRPYTTINSR